MGGYVVFSEDFLSRVRSEYPLHELISTEMKLRRAGKDHLGCCPFHEERSASFRVSSDRNTYHCFGCGESGDIIDWFRRRHDLSFRDAVLRAATLARVDIPTQALDTEPPATRMKRAKIGEALIQAHRLYKHGLTRSDAAVAYLCSQRGLTKDTIDRFGLGVVAKGVIDLMRNKIAPTVLTDSGLAIEKDTGELYDRFRHRIMFPILNEGGSLIGFAGRSVRDNPEVPKYLNSPETVLFRKGAELYGLHLAKRTIRRSRLAVVVEGYFDVLSLHQAGDERAVAPMGTAITSMQVRRLLAHADSVVFAFDGDDAGRRAALNATSVFLQEMRDGTSAAILVLPDGQDPDSYVRNNGGSPWKALVDSAKPLSEFLCDILRKELVRTLPESQVRVAERAVGFLADVKHAPLFRQALHKKFEEVIGLTIDSPSCLPTRRSRAPSP